MKGIILAGGTGSRLYPITISVNKQLLPVYDKPMIYYPLTTLMMAGIKDILIITAPESRHQFEDLLGNGNGWGLNLSYAVQDQPRGLAEAFIIGRDFIAGDQVAMILGDNIFYGHGLIDKLSAAGTRGNGATIFAYWVSDPKRYGVVTLDKDGRAKSIVEKPEHPQSNWAITGLYFFDETVSGLAANVKPSLRGELEIVDIIRAYQKQGTLFTEQLNRGYAWLDTGTQATLLQAAQFVETIEQRQGLKIACPEEIALRMGYIDLNQFTKIAEKLSGNAYGEYLKRIANEFSA